MLSRLKFDATRVIVVRRVGTGYRELRAIRIMTHFYRHFFLVEHVADELVCHQSREGALEKSDKHIRPVVFVVGNTREAGEDCKIDCNDLKDGTNETERLPTKTLL